MDSSERLRFKMEPIEVADRGVGIVLFTAGVSFSTDDKVTVMLFTALSAIPLANLILSAGVSSMYSGRLLGDSSTKPGRLETSSIAASVNGGEGGDSCRMTEEGGCTRGGA